MILASVSLQNFRNYEKMTFSFSPDVTILSGPNTCGKTNVLEAIYFLAVGKSFRADQDMEAIRWGSQLSRITLKKEEETLEIVLTEGAVGGQKTPLKRFFVNEIPKRPVDFLGRLRAVLFWPEDLELVINSPSRRRNYLDFVLTQIDWEYRRSLSSYERGVRQRNKVLERIRKGEATRLQLTFWDQLLIKDGNYLTRKRDDFIEAINLSSKPFGGNRLYYDSSIISEGRLSQYAEAEVAAAVTLVGPHRDDFQFFEKERNLAKFGSRGEQRLTVLWLKLAELDYIEKTTGVRPLLLLDDIFSELDYMHRQEVLAVIHKQQTVITTTDIHLFPKALLDSAKVIELG